LKFSWVHIFLGHPVGTKFGYCSGSQTGDKLTPGVICDSSRGNAEPNHNVVLYYERSLQYEFSTQNAKNLYWWVIRHNRYIDLGNSSNKFGNHWFTVW